MGNFFKDISTGIDNQTHDVGRVAGILGLLTFLGLEIFVVVYKGMPFDMTAFGTAFGLMIVAIGAALKLKAETEPKSGEQPKQ